MPFGSSEPKHVQHKSHLTVREMDFMLDSAYTSGEKILNWRDYGYSTIDTCYASVYSAIARRKKMLAVEVDRDNDLVIIFNPARREAIPKVEESKNTPDPTSPFEVIDALPKRKTVRKSIEKTSVLFNKLEESNTKLAKISTEFFGVDKSNKLDVKRLCNRIRMFIKRNNIPYKLMSFNGDSIYVERIEE